MWIIYPPAQKEGQIANDLVANTSDKAASITSDATEGMRLFGGGERLVGVFEN